jgi:hypothetical protein
MLPPAVDFQKMFISLKDGTISHSDLKTLPGETATLEELQREAAESSLSIAKGYGTLNKTLKRYGEVIQSSTGEEDAYSTKGNLGERLALQNFCPPAPRS